MEDIHRTDAVGGLRVIDDRERSRDELFLRERSDRVRQL